MPYLKQGQASGLKLFGIRPGSLFEAVGIVIGDTLVEVNELPLHTVHQTLDAYEALKDLRVFDLKLLRSEHLVTISFEEFPDDDEQVNR